MKLLLFVLTSFFTLHAMAKTQETMLERMKPYRNYYAITDSVTEPQYWLMVHGEKEDVSVTCDFNLNSLESHGLTSLSGGECSGYNDLKVLDQTPVTLPAALKKSLIDKAATLINDEEKRNRFLDLAKEPNNFFITSYGYGQKFQINEMVPLPPEWKEVTPVSQMALNAEMTVIFNPISKKVVNMSPRKSFAHICNILSTSPDRDCNFEPQWVDFLPPESLRGFVFLAHLSKFKKNGLAQSFHSDELPSTELSQLQELVKKTLAKNAKRVDQLRVTQINNYLPKDFKQIFKFTLEANLRGPGYLDRADFYHDGSFDVIAALTSPQTVSFDIPEARLKGQVVIDLSETPTLTLRATYNNSTTLSKVTPLEIPRRIQSSGREFIAHFFFSDLIWDNRALAPEIDFGKIELNRFNSLNVSIDTGGGVSPVHLPVKLGETIPHSIPKQK